MRSVTLLIAPLFALSLVALAGTAPARAQAPEPSVAAGEAPGPEKPRRVNRNGPITAADIAATHHTDAFQLVQALRPTWLRTRGTGSLRGAEYVKVYQGGILLGGVGALRQIPIAAVAGVSFLDATQATQRFGTDHGSGVILVTLR